GPLRGGRHRRRHPGPRSVHRMGQVPGRQEDEQPRRRKMSVRGHFPQASPRGKPLPARPARGLRRGPGFRPSRAAGRLRSLRQPQEGKLMERTQVLDLMGTLKLYGMRGAYDEIMATAIKRQHEPPRAVGDLLSAEIAEKQARSDRKSTRLNFSHVKI